MPLRTPSGGRQRNSPAMGGEGRSGSGGNALEPNHRDLAVIPASVLVFVQPSDLFAQQAEEPVAFRGVPLGGGSRAERLAQVLDGDVRSRDHIRVPLRVCRLSAGGSDDDQVLTVFANANRDLALLSAAEADCAQDDKDLSSVCPARI